METDKIKFTAGLDGTITCEIYNSIGEIQDLTGCNITFKLMCEYEDIALVSEPMFIFDKTKCIVTLKPEHTEMLSRGEYEFQLIIFDILGKKQATERIKISVDKIVE